jgi:exosome complex component RRP40
MEVEEVPTTGSSAPARGALPASGAGDGSSAAFPERVVVPGDDVTEVITEFHSRSAAGDAPVRLGAGLDAVNSRVVANKAGVLAFRAPNRYHVLTAQTRYVPAVGDSVVGIVTDKGAEHYRVRLHATGNAILPLLAFDGASKRNKPNLAVGAVVYARVAVVSRFMDPELSCQG